MICFRTMSVFDALQFDGTPASAAAIEAALPRRVARHLTQDDVLMVVGPRDLVPVQAGAWISWDHCSGGLRIWSDAAFRREHQF